MKERQKKWRESTRRSRGRDQDLIDLRKQIEVKCNKLMRADISFSNAVWFALDRLTQETQHLRTLHAQNSRTIQALRQQRWEASTPPPVNTRPHTDRAMQLLFEIWSDDINDLLEHELAKKVETVLVEAGLVDPDGEDSTVDDSEDDDSVDGVELLTGAELEQATTHDDELISDPHYIRAGTSKDALYWNDKELAWMSKNNASRFTLPEAQARLRTLRPRMPSGAIITNDRPVHPPVQSSAGRFYLRLDGKYWQERGNSKGAWVSSEKEATVYTPRKTAEAVYDRIWMHHDNVYIQPEDEHEQEEDEGAGAAPTYHS